MSVYKVELFCIWKKEIQPTCHNSCQVNKQAQVPHAMGVATTWTLYVFPADLRASDGVFCVHLQKASHHRVHTAPVGSWADPPAAPTPQAVGAGRQEEAGSGWMRMMIYDKCFFSQLLLFDSACYFDMKQDILNIRMSNKPSDTLKTRNNNITNSHDESLTDVTFWNYINHTRKLPKELKLNNQKLCLDFLNCISKLIQSKWLQKMKMKYQQGDVQRCLVQIFCMLPSNYYEITTKTPTSARQESVETSK